jgi:hypothetical protein
MEQPLGLNTQFYVLEIREGWDDHFMQQPNCLMMDGNMQEFWYKIEK